MPFAERSFSKPSWSMKSRRTGSCRSCVQSIRIDWTQDLQDPVRRDFIDQEGFEKLLSAKGIANDTLVILYGGNNNWFASYAYWYFKLYGHDNVKLLDGGRKKWELDARELVEEVPERP